MTLDNFTPIQKLIFVDAFKAIICDNYYQEEKDFDNEGRLSERRFVYPDGSLKVREELPNIAPPKTPASPNFAPNVLEVGTNANEVPITIGNPAPIWNFPIFIGYSWTKVVNPETNIAHCISLNLETPSRPNTPDNINIGAKFPVNIAKTC